MGTYSITQTNQGHPKDAAGQDVQAYQTWCYTITYQPAATEPQAFPKGAGDYWFDFTKGALKPVDGAAPAGVAPGTWPATTVDDPHPKQTGNTEYLQPTTAPNPVNNADGSVSMTFCFPVSTAKKAGDIRLSLSYKDASGYHEVLAPQKLFGPLAMAESHKDQQAMLTLLASYEGIKSAAMASALSHGASSHGFLAMSREALAHLEASREEEAAPAHTPVATSLAPPAPHRKGKG